MLGCRLVQYIQYIPLCTCVCLHVGVQASAVHTVYTPCVPVCAFMLGCRLEQYIQYILPPSLSNKRCVECTSCTSGPYQNDTAATTCLPCPKGHFTSDNGSIVCLQCEKGQQMLWWGVSCGCVPILVSPY